MVVILQGVRFTLSNSDCVHFHLLLSDTFNYLEIILKSEFKISYAFSRLAFCSFS